MNFLFVCSRNKWRSRTAETHFRNHPFHKIVSAGTDDGAKVKVTEALLHWADIIFAMENKHRQRIIEKYNTKIFDEKMIVLDIPDEYEYMDKELIAMLELALQPYLNEK